MEKKSFKCPECSKIFKLARVMGAHRFRAHGVKGTAPSALFRARKKEGKPQEGITIQEAIAGLEMEVQVTIGIIAKLKQIAAKGRI